MKYVDEKTGSIKKGKLIEDALKKAETIAPEKVKKVLTEFGKQVVEHNHRFISLHSRDINYTQIFEVKEDVVPEYLAEYILDFFKDSSFATYSEDSDTVSLHDMLEIKDYELRPSETHPELRLYIDGTFFLLASATWQVETIEGGKL